MSSDSVADLEVVRERGRRTLERVALAEIGNGLGVSHPIEELPAADDPDVVLRLSPVEEVVDDFDQADAERAESGQEPIRSVPTMGRSAWGGRTGRRGQDIQSQDGWDA